MGITNANSLCKQLLNNSQVLQREYINEFILYIDGPILVFSGLRKDSLQSQIVSETVKLIKKNIIIKFNSIIKRIAIYGKLMKIIIVFDGKAPRMKLQTQEKRNAIYTETLRQIIKLTFADITEYFKNLSLCIDDRKIEIVVENPMVGEAESIIYKKRDPKYSSVLFTKDTDLYAIAYGHANNKKKSTDNVYIYNDSLLEKNGNYWPLFNMEKFKCKLNAFSFRLLMTLAGTDFNESIFTNTMLSGIFSTLNYMANDEIQNEIDEIITKINNSKIIIHSIGYFMLLVYIAKKKMKLKIIMPRIKTHFYENNINNDDNHPPCSIIKWVIEYFEMGVDYCNYDKKIESYEFDKNKFLLQLTNLSQIFTDKEMQNLKSLFSLKITQSPLLLLSSSSLSPPPPPQSIQQIESIKKFKQDNNLI